MQPLIEPAQLSRDQWLELLARICLADIRKMFDEHGNPIAITKLADSEAAAIAAFEAFSDTESSDEPQLRGSTTRVRMVDQLRALELYGKAMGYFVDRREMMGSAERRPIITVEFVDPPIHDASDPRKYSATSVE